jgi:hypothetical protein
VASWGKRHCCVSPPARSVGEIFPGCSEVSVRAAFWAKPGNWIPRERLLEFCATMGSEMSSLRAMDTYEHQSSATPDVLRAGWNLIGGSGREIGQQNHPQSDQFFGGSLDNLAGNGYLAPGSCFKGVRRSARRRYDAIQEETLAW